MLFSDAHLHLNPVKGLGAERVGEKLAREGFWFTGLVGLPPYYYGLNKPSVDSFEKAINILVSQARALREKGIKVKTLAGFHPAEVDEYNRMGLTIREVYELAERVLKLIESKIKEGVIDGIGEVGRQHYGTSYARISVAESVMIRALELARDLNVVVHLHLDQSGWPTCHLLSKVVELIGVKRKLVLVHHANKHSAQPCVEYGLPISAPVKQEIPEIIRLPGLILVESDYIDDNERPGASSYPWDIASVFTRLVKTGVIEEGVASRVLVDNIVDYYGVEPP